MLQQEIHFNIQQTEALTRYPFPSHQSSGTLHVPDSTRSDVEQTNDSSKHLHILAFVFVFCLENNTYFVYSNFYFFTLFVTNEMVQLFINYPLSHFLVNDFKIQFSNYIFGSNTKRKALGIYRNFKCTTRPSRASTFW